MLINNRVVYSDDSVLTDFSRELSDLADSKQAFNIVAADDAIYIGSDLPFNHRYFSVRNQNAVAAQVAVAIWSGSAFEPAVDVLDFTAVGGKPLAKSGIIMFTPDRNKGWGRVPTTEDIPELATLKIYGCYWVKITFSADIAFALEYVGHKFSTDSDLNIYYGDLCRETVREAYFEVPTNTWDRIHCAAAEEIIRDLRARQIIWSPNQILDPDQFRDASAHKLAEIVYSPGGLNVPEKATDAARKYREAMNKVTFNVDRNGDARLQQCEKVPEARVVRR